MKKREVGCAVALVLVALVACVHADTFATGESYAFEMEFVPVRNPGNVVNTNVSNTLTGKGAVPYRYRMGTTEVSRAHTVVLIWQVMHGRSWK